jgi:hypothetical protein
MLQRIQSVYLALVVAISVTLYFMPLAVVLSNTGPANTQVADMLSVRQFTKSSHEAFGVENYQEKMSTPWLMITLNFLSGAIALYAISLFKNRKRQLLCCRINLIIICLFTGIVFWMEEQVKSNTGGKITYLFGTYLPIIQLILVYMAERSIRKDDELVKSADRLR